MNNQSRVTAWPFLLLWGLGLFLSVSIVHATPIDILVKLSDVEKQEPRNAEVRFEAVAPEGAQISQELKKQGPGEYVLKGDFNLKNVDVYEIYIDIDNPFSKRCIKVRCDGFKDKPKQSHQFFVAKETEFTYTYLDRGRRYLNSPPFDRALAHFEIAVEKDPLMEPLDQYKVRLHYNYAVALVNSIKYLNYNNIEKATTIYKNLLSFYKDHKMFFDREKITEDLLNNGIKDLEAYELNIKYGNIRSSFVEKGYRQAAALAMEGLQEYEKKPQQFLAIGLNRKRLYQDALDSYGMAVKQAEAEGASDVQQLKASFQSLRDRL